MRCYRNLSLPRIVYSTKQIRLKKQKGKNYFHCFCIYFAFRCSTSVPHIIAYRTENERCRQILLHIDSYLIKVRYAFKTHKSFWGWNFRGNYQYILVSSPRHCYKRALAAKTRWKGKALYAEEMKSKIKLKDEDHAEPQ